MKPTELKSLIVSRFKARIEKPILIESSPGMGKTSIPQQVAKDLGVACRVLHAPLMQPEDYGFPVINKDRDDVDFIVSKNKFPLEGSDCPDQGIIVVDELPQCDNTTQKILANFALAREIHGKRLKPGWLVICTGNRASDRAGANRLLSHLKSRVTPIDLEISLDDWTNWALANQVKTEVIGFIRFRPDLLSAFDPQADKCPDPRGWVDGVSASLGVIDASQEFEVFKGDVGEGASAEFCAFLKLFRKLPSIDAIIVNPTGVEVPNDPATLYAVCAALASKSTPGNFGKVMTYVNRMPPEFSVLYVRDAIKRHTTLQTCPEFIQWASGTGGKLLS